LNTVWFTDVFAAFCHLFVGGYFTAPRLLPRVIWIPQLDLAAAEQETFYHRYGFGWLSR
jgi:hypothetical protein